MARPRVVLVGFGLDDRDERVRQALPAVVACWSFKEALNVPLENDTVKKVVVYPGAPKGVYEKLLEKYEGKVLMPTNLFRDLRSALSSCLGDGNASLVTRLIYIPPPPTEKIRPSNIPVHVTSLVW